MKVRIYQAGTDGATYIEHRKVDQAERFEPAGSRLSTIPSSAVNGRILIFNPEVIFAMLIEPDDEQPEVPPCG